MEGTYRVAGVQLEELVVASLKIAVGQYPVHQQRDFSFLRSKETG